MGHMGILLQYTKSHLCIYLRGLEVDLGLGFGVQGLGFRVQGFGSRVLGLGF